MGLASEGLSFTGRSDDVWWSRLERWSSPRARRRGWEAMRELIPADPIHSTCNLGWAELAHTESVCGNVGLAVARELGAGYICCSATDFPQ